MFIDTDHKEAYKEFLIKANINNYDNERKSLFYVLAMLRDTRARVNDLYDFKNNWIKIDGLEKPWQTSGSMKVTRLAFNLYNGFIQTECEASESEILKTTPLDVFSLDKEYLEYMLYAVKIRFGQG